MVFLTPQIYTYHIFTHTTSFNTNFFFHNNSTSTKSDIPKVLHN